MVERKEEESSIYQLCDFGEAPLARERIAPQDCQGAGKLMPRACSNCYHPVYVVSFPSKTVTLLRQKLHALGSQELGYCVKSFMTRRLRYSVSVLHQLCFSHFPLKYTLRFYSVIPQSQLLACSWNNEYKWLTNTNKYEHSSFSSTPSSNEPFKHIFTKC